MTLLRSLAFALVRARRRGPTAGALAQSYPARPIEFIIPFAPGGPTDTAIRLIQPTLSANLGVPVVLVNKAGGGGAIGMDGVGQGQARRLHAGGDGALDADHPAGDAAGRAVQDLGLRADRHVRGRLAGRHRSRAARRGRRWRS